MGGHRDVLVHYSLACVDEAVVPSLARQLSISLTTLRVNNPTTSVAIFVHGRVPNSIAAIAAEHGAEIVRQPDYRDRLVQEVGPLGEALSTYAPLQKFLNFAALAERAPGHALCLDCDTVVFGSLDRLIERNQHAAVVAREEVGSANCIYGGDPAYLDEAALARAVNGFRPAPAFNTGVVLFNRIDWNRAAQIGRSMLTYALRFAIWMAINPPPEDSQEFGDIIDLSGIRDALAGQSGARLRNLAVEFPSVNRWILEEVALWVAVGQAGLDVGFFDPATVAQAGEPLHAALPSHIWHYFTSNQHRMEERVGLARVVRAAAGELAGAGCC